MKKLLLQGIILVSFTFLFSSCFKIKETLILSRDGSGIFGFKVDMSESKYLLQMAKSLAEATEGRSPDEQLNRSLSRTLGYLEKTPGISSTQLIKNDDDFIYDLTFSFDDIDALNRAIIQFFPENQRKDEVFFRYARKNFERTGAINIYSLVEQETQHEKSRINGIDPGVVFSNVTYSTNYIFERKIKKYTNQSASLSDDKKEISLNYYVFRDPEGIGVENKIKFR
jgi:hypothetical protein